MAVMQFCEQLKNHLAFLRRSASYDDYGSERYFTLNSTDASATGTRVHVQRGRDGRVPDQVLFLDSHFKPAKATGKYDVDRAVGLLLRHEAHTQLARQKEQERQRKLERYQHRSKVVRNVAQKVNNPGLTLENKPDYDDEWYNIRIAIPCEDAGPEDEALLGALMDYIQDDPFILTRNIPTKNVIQCDQPLTIKEELLSLISSHRINEYHCERIFTTLQHILQEEEEDRKE